MVWATFRTCTKCKAVWDNGNENGFFNYLRSLSLILDRIIYKIYWVYRDLETIAANVKPICEVLEAWHSGLPHKETVYPQLKAYF